GGAPPADGRVGREARVVAGEGPRVEDAAAEGVHGGAEAREADHHVVRHDSIGEGQGASVPDAAAPQKGVPAGDGQAVDTHRHAAVDLKDPAGVVAADGQPAGARPVDGQIVCDAQLTAGQGDGAVTSRSGEADQVGAG